MKQKSPAGRRGFFCRCLSGLRGSFPRLCGIGVAVGCCGLILGFHWCGGDQLVAFIQVDQAHALCVAADYADVADGYANHLPARADQHQRIRIPHGVSADKVLKLLDTVRDYEFKERRTGVYDALREILKSKPGAGA